MRKKPFAGIKGVGGGGVENFLSKKLTIFDGYSPLPTWVSYF
jgi:hypothetical protein